MKKQSFSLLVDSIRHNNIDSLLQLLVNAKIRVISKLIKRAVIMVEADRVLDEKDQFNYEEKWAQIESQADGVVLAYKPSTYPLEVQTYKYVAQRVSERLNDEVTENTVRYYLGLA